MNRTVRVLSRFAAVLASVPVLADPATGIVVEQNEAFAVSQGLESPWAGSPFAVTAGRYYRIDLETRSRSGALVSSRYRDVNGDALVADNYNLVRSSQDWSPVFWYFLAPPGAVSGEIAMATRKEEICDVRHLRVSEVNKADVRAWMDSELAALPPVTFTPPADRWQALPRTYARLQSGEPLRVVMLGDSIINDTYNGLLALMLERQWPKATLTLIPSVRGGTGVGYYQKENRVKSYVLDHAPDLVIIGGVCHDYDLSAMRSVVEQIRAVSSAEILVMTGAMAPESAFRNGLPGKFRTSCFEAARRVRAFNGELPVLAAEQGSGFFDMRRVWDAYIYDSGFPAACYMRDETHGDMTGKLLLAAVLSRYLVKEAGAE